jgi:hypothetical protein
MTSYFRVHPNINFARVGSSKEYYIAPETAAGEVVDTASGRFGGLPIKAGTEDTVITAADFRDADQRPRRQAARFRIFAYQTPQDRYPGQDPGREIKIGDEIDGKTIKDIIWSVHLANKKNNNYSITSANGQEEGIVAYEHGNTPPVRNPSYGKDLNNEKRRATLIIDAGPRALPASTNGNETLAFDNATEPSYADDAGQVQTQLNYPVSFPDQHFEMFNPLGQIDTLGEMTIEPGSGRLIVVGGYGRASGIVSAGRSPSLIDAIDNDGWFDDTSDGPVKAMILFHDGTSAEAVHGWVVCTDPGYAPQTRNVVSTWDDMFSSWVENLNLLPDLFANGAYNRDYKASYDSDVLPVFHGAFLQRWNTNLPSKGLNGHAFIANIKPSDDPKAKLPGFKDLIRDPDSEAEDSEGVKMPLALGDAMRSFLSLTRTQYFLLKQWHEGKFAADGSVMGAGEKLDKVVLENCLGGRYSPGIDLTFIVRDVRLYHQRWQGETGPFRINLQRLDYGNASKDKPFLQQGYVPLRDAGVEPGDLCKFMSQPWHTDYNSCATHTPDPNPAGNNTLYWSWPAQRPVNVYPASQCTYDAATNTWDLGGQLYSVRGNEGHGTSTPYPQQQGRYQCYLDFVKNWHKVGFVIQGCQIPVPQGGDYGADKFLEVASLFDTDGDMMAPWPTAEQPGYKAPKDCGPSK